MPVRAHERYSSYSRVLTALAEVLSRISTKVRRFKQTVQGDKKRTNFVNPETWLQPEQSHPGSHVTALDASWYLPAPTDDKLHVSFLI